MNQETHYKRLKRLFDKSLPALTVCYARRYLADYPEHGSAWLLLGIALVELGRYQEAEQIILKAIDLCPSQKRQIPLSEMGHLFREAGDYYQAAAWYKKAIEVSPKDASYHIYLGAVLAKQGNLHEAEEVHRTAIACPEGCIDEAYLNLGLVLRALERFREAADCFREAIRLDPEYREARRALRDVERCIKWTEPKLT